MKRKPGDRRDGVLLRDLDAMHFICPIIYPNRCDNEAFISEKIDLTNIDAYLKEKNANNPDYQYNLFQIIVTAFLKTITLRPKMNRFIANCNMYQRNEVSAAFVVKKEFSDKGEEGLAFVHAAAEDTIDTIHEKIRAQVFENRGSKVDASTDSMNTFNRMPRFIAKTAVKFVCFLDRHGWVPAQFIKTDPYYSSVLLSNLGSIRLHSGYHHLTNWGTTSVFVVIGEKKQRPFTDENGNTVMKNSIDLGLTIDERIADGYYYSKTVKLLKKLLEDPRLLETSLSEKVEF